MKTILLILLISCYNGCLYKKVKTADGRKCKVEMQKVKGKPEKFWGSYEP